MKWHPLIKLGTWIQTILILIITFALAVEQMDPQWICMCGIFSIVSIAISICICLTIDD